MKFFIFNIAVVSALAYLIWGNTNKPWDQISKSEIEHSVIKPVKSVLKNVQKVAKEKLESLKNKPSLNADHSADTESPKSENIEVTSTEIPAPKPTTSKSSVTEDQVIHVASRPTPIMQRPNHLPEQSKEMVPPVANNAKIVRKEPGSRFMTASERRRELNKLAREMELLFVDKLNM